MTARYLLDASAVLAWLHDEPGRDRVEAALEESVLSAVNAAEVTHKLVSRGATPQHAREILDRALIPTVELTAEIARRMADLSPMAGLSLGDRACLATAQTMGLLALSADRRWADLPLAGSFELIR